MTMKDQTTKNGYEIRAGLLQMAQRIVEQNAHAVMTQTKEWKEITPDQITEVAEKLNLFVQKKD